MSVRTKSVRYREWTFNTIKKAEGRKGKETKKQFRKMISRDRVRINRPGARASGYSERTNKNAEVFNPALALYRVWHTLYTSRP